VSSKVYTALGWVVWQILSRAAKVKLSQNRSKVGAAAVVAGVVIAGIALAHGDEQN
jgi:hypothetical protein